MSNACYKIPAGNVEKLHIKLEKFNKKAIKLDQPELSIKIVHEQLEKNKLYHWVQVVGNAPLIAGYKILGKINFDQGMIIPSSAPGCTIPRHYYTNNAASHCEHCNTDRVRKTTYILESIYTGETIQIGSTCIADFIDRNITNYIMTYFLWLNQLDEILEDDDFECPGDFFYYTMDELYIAQVCIDNLGWVSKSKAAETGDYSTFDLYHEYSLKDVTDEHMKTVKAAIKWLKSQDTSNEYFFKLDMLLDCKFCPKHHISFLISLLGSYKNHLVREASLIEKSPIPVTDERMIITGKVLKTDVQENAFGYRDVMTVQDDRGFILWGSIPSCNDTIRQGTYISFAAKITVSDKDPCFGFYKRPTKLIVNKP